MAIGRERLCAAQLDTFDDFDVLLPAQILDNFVHGMLGHGMLGSGVARSSTHANDVTLTPPARRRRDHCVIPAVSRFPDGGPALRSSVSPQRIFTCLARLPERRAGPLIFLLGHRTFLQF